MRDLGIYLDNNATTAVDEEVLEAMLPALRESYGNPSSTHSFGEAAAETIAAARSSVARLIGARSPSEIVFTSGGTESNNAALQAALAPFRASGASGGTGGAGTVLAGSTEHPSVRRPLEEWGRELSIEWLGVGRDGRADLTGLVARLDEIGGRLRLLTLHWANNETGVCLTDEELAAVGELTTSRGVPFHVDAVQAPGKVPMRVAELGIDLLSISAHKFHGPKGVGALYVRDRGGRAPLPPLIPLIHGGPQEQERRAGTPNVPGIAGMGRAAELARRHAEDDAAREGVRALRNRLEAGILAAIPGTRINGAAVPRLDNTSSLTFPGGATGVDGELLLTTLAAEGVAVSSGSACSAATKKPSEVLLAMGFSPEEANRTLRFSLSRRTTELEVEAAVERVARIHGELSLFAAG